MTLARSPLTFLCLLMLFVGGVSCSPKKDVVTVYAAASLTDVAEEAAAAYRRETGTQVQVRIGSSGLLSVDIEQGAPADLFLSADPAWTKRLADKNLLRRESIRTLAHNSLVAVVPVRATEVPEDASALPSLDHVALADPETSPAGAHARQALTTLHLWEALNGKRVETPDVRAALALVERGEAGAGIVYDTDAQSSKKVRIAFRLPPEACAPIAYTAAVLRSTPHPQAARAFLEFLTGPRGVEILRRHGFTEL